MKSKKISNFIGWLAILVLLSLVIVQIDDWRNSNEIEEMPTIGYIAFKVYDPVYVAMDMGFFEDEGLIVELAGDVIAGPNAIQAVSSGYAQAGLSSIPAIVNANAAGLPIQGVVDIQTSFDNQPLQKWYTQADNDSISSMEDVCDKTYAVNIWRSSFHYTTLRGFDKYGIDEECTNFILLSFGDQINALVNGSVDIIGLIQPYQSYLEHDFAGEFKEVWNDVADITGESHVSLIFVNRVWAESNPDQAAAFATGISNAIRYIEANQEEVKPIIAKYTGIPDYAIPDYHFTEDGRVVEGDVQAWMDYLVERGDLTAEWVTADMVFTNDYNENLK